MSERALLAITGPDRVQFLQALVTNDVSRARPDALVYAALLTPQGKYLADFFVLAQDEALLLDVAAAKAPMLAQRLAMYRLRAAVEISESPLGVTTTGEGGLADPRHPELPRRRYGASGPCPDPLALRVAHIVPQTDIELTPDSYILECGFERLNGVDFRKGCYVGQEVTARMKHKTDLRKGLVQLQIKGDAPIGSAITSDGKPAGTLFSQAEGRALAHMRFDRIAAEMHAGEAILNPA